MTTGFKDPRLETGTLLLADISGYTTFLGLVTAVHPEMIGSAGPIPPAYPIMSSLLDVVVDRIAPTFRLSEIEGDAVFAYATDDQLSAGETALQTIRSAYGGFRGRIDEAMAHHQKHECDACSILPTLDLKFLLHHGQLVVQRIAGRERLLGPAVNLTHRLLKNSVSEQTGRRGYLFTTDEAAEQLGLSKEIGVRHKEEYADVGSISGTVIELDAV
jgi:Protein of unknown function (DUF2652)